MITPQEAYELVVEALPSNRKLAGKCFRYKDCYAFPLNSTDNKMLLDAFLYVDVKNGDIYPFDPAFDSDELLKSEDVSEEINFNTLSHHGIKGMKWGELNPETKFKYGLTDISPAAAAAAGGYVDGDYKEFLKKKLASGDLNAAEINSLKMQRIIDNSNMKGSSSSGSLKPVSDEKLAEARSQLSSGKISIDEYRKITKGEDVSTSNSSESESGTAGRNFLQEALSRARQNKEEEEKKEEKKSGSGGSGGKGGSGSKGKGGGGGGKGGKGSKEKEYEPDIDEGPMDYTKSNYFNQLNASKKAKRLRMQRSITNRSGSTHVQKHGRSLKKRLYHSAMVAKLKGEFLDE